MKKEAPLHSLAAYLPEGTLEPVVAYLQQYKVHLTIAKERQSVLGDYRQPDYRQGHRISVNGNLNPYAFLLTLLHELAHLVAFIQYGPHIASHGKEWKLVYGRILHEFTARKIFPEPIEAAVRQSLKNPAATTCGEEALTRVLRKYDPPGKHKLLVENLKIGELFATKDGRIFRQGERVRKRYRCTEVGTGKVYLFSPLYEVTPVHKEQG